MIASSVSARIEDLFAAAGHLFAPAELDVGAQAQLPRHFGQGLHLDHGRAQLGQLSLGQAGVAAEQRVGDDQPEDRVAEELQPLVGGRVGVLVGEGAVRQRAVQRLGHDGHAEGTPELGGIPSGVVPVPGLAHDAHRALLRTG